MNDSTTIPFADPEALLQALAQALGREGPHPGLLPVLLDGLARWDDPRLGLELLLLLQDMPPRPGLPPPLLARLGEGLAKLLPGLGSDLQPYAAWLVACLRVSPAWADLLAHDAEAPGVALGMAPPAIFAESLFQLLLCRCVICDAWLESLLTRLRRRLLIQGQTSEELRAWEPALLLLAHQAWNNGYVWFCEAAESQILTGLKAAAEPMLNLLAACYAPLRAGLLPEPLPAAWESLVNVSLRAPARERDLATSLTLLTPLPTQDPCLDFYAETPYPHWQAPERLTVEPLAERLETIFPGQGVPRALADGAEALIAGCGTGQQVAQQWLQWPQGNYTAIDLSRPALAYAARLLAEQLPEMATLRLAQADLNQLAQVPGWQARFALIGCGGVLHHLADPEAGLAVLARLLAPGGLLKLGVYSRRAREPLYQLRTLLGVRGGEGPDGVRALRRRLLSLRKDPAAPPELTRLAAWAQATRDFWTLPECRDLLCHPREQAYSPLELQAMCERQGLEVLGPELWDPAGYGLYRWRQGEAGLGDLAAWDAIEAERPGLFAGMIVLWLRKPGDGLPKSKTRSP